jgi:hypothetical protein
MVDLAIFGDSYSYEQVLYSDYKDHPNVKGLSWVAHLRSNFKITNYSVRGCDPYYMYKKFLENQSNHDKIIFLFPRPGRISTVFEGNEIHISNVLEPDKSEVHQAYAQWHKYLYDEEKEIHHALHLKDSIRALRPDVKFMYGTNWAHPRESESLMYISRLENDAWNEDAISIRTKYIDLRYNHLTATNNFILYRTVKYALSNGGDIIINPEDFIKPSEEEKECYLIPK